MVDKKYDTPQDVIDKIDEYFANPDYTPTKYKHDEYDVPRITVGAVCRYIGYHSKYIYQLPKQRGEEWQVVIDHLNDRMQDHYEAQGQNGNGAFAAFMITHLSKSGLKVKFNNDSTELEKARALLDAAASGDIDIDVMQKMMGAIRTASDINKVDELERKVNELLRIAGVDE